MSKLILSTIALLLATATSSFAFAVESSKSSDVSKRARWTCTADGKRSFGPPVGDMWETAWGYGSTEREAQSDAMSDCYGRGLSMCMVRSCWK